MRTGPTNDSGQPPELGIRIRYPRTKEHHQTLLSETLAMGFPSAERKSGIIHLRMPPKTSEKWNNVLLLFLRILTMMSIGVTARCLWKALQEPNPVETNAQNMVSAEKSNTGDKLPIISGELKMISLIGERNSGTRWISNHLKECFSSSVKVEHRLVRHKHWFQHDILPDIRINNKTLVIALFRNPIDWVDAMRRRPHHAPMHFQKHWSEFVQIPWTLPKRPDLDVTFIEHKKRKHMNSTKAFCHENFLPHQLVSCIKYPFPTKQDYKKYLKNHNLGNVLPSFSGNLPRYELKENGRPYASILEMRAAKIKNFLSIKDWDWIMHVHVEQYERLLQEGTSHLLDYITSITGVSANCTPIPPQIRSHKQSLDPDYINWMNHNVDWNTEELIGYIPWGAVDAAS